MYSLGVQVSSDKTITLPLDVVKAWRTTLPPTWIGDLAALILDITQHTPDQDLHRALTLILTTALTETNH